MDPAVAGSGAAAHERLRHAIVRLELAPGAPVSEAQLVARFGFSKARSAPRSPACARSGSCSPSPAAATSSPC